MAITDHGAMFGVIDFFNAAKKAGVKPIIGMEGYLARRSRFDRDPQQRQKSLSPVAARAEPDRAIRIC